MWRFLRKRRALRAYRTTVFQYLRRTFGRKLYYSPEEVRQAVRDIRASDEFVCYALGMFCEQAAFDADHAARGETCDYGAMRHEVFAHAVHLAHHPASPDAFDGGCDPHDPGAGADAGHHGHHGHHDGGGWDGGGHHGGGGHHH